MAALFGVLMHRISDEFYFPGINQASRNQSTLTHVNIGPGGSLKHQLECALQVHVATRENNADALSF